MVAGVNRYPLCLSLYGTTAQICEAMLEASDADLYEIRLDRSPGCDVGKIRATSTKPLLLTAHGMPELLEKWSGHADFVDVEQATPAYPNSIRSYHGTSGDPESMLLQLLGGKFSKLVLEVEDYPTIVKLLELNTIHASRSICFASGETGSFSRILSLFYGSQWSYVCLPGRSTGTGQFTLDEYINVYRIRRFETKGKRNGGPEAKEGKGGRHPKVFGIVGDPIAHSSSPAYHNRRFEEEGLPWIYLPFRCRDVVSLLRNASGFGGIGFSITHPWKQRILSSIDEQSAEVQILKSCNTVCFRDGKWHGTNTDLVGVRALLESSEIVLNGKVCLIVGAGASARVVASVVRPHVAELIFMNRTREKADLLASEFQGRSVPLSSLVPYDILFQTTPVGLEGDQTPVDPALIRSGTVVVEAIYEPSSTPLLRIAESRGCRVFNGKKWFLAQAEAQLEWWRKLLGKH